jgi:sporulation protein YpjB
MFLKRGGFFMHTKAGRMMKSIFLIAIFLFSLSGFRAYAESAQSSQQDIDRLSQDVLILTEQNQFAQAKGKLNELATLFPKLIAQKKLSIEAIQLAANTLTSGKRAFAAIKPEKQVLLEHAQRIRLMIDALTHPNQPMWKDYHQKYIEQVNELIAIAEKRDKTALAQAMRRYIQLYTNLKPALAMSLKPEAIEMLDSINRFIIKQIDQGPSDWQAITKALEQLRDASDNIFLGNDQFVFGTHLEPSAPYKAFSIVFAFLLSALTYTGWKMYRGKRYSV